METVGSTLPRSDCCVTGICVNKDILYLKATLAKRIVAGDGCEGSRKKGHLHSTGHKQLVAAKYGLYPVLPLLVREKGYSTLHKLSIQKNCW